MGISMEAQKEAILEKSKKTMSVPEMRRLLGLKKTDSYWLVHRNFFQTYIVNGQMRVDIASFEKWYANQVKHKKVNGEEPGAELMKSSYSFRDAANLLGIHSSNLYEIWRDQNLKTITVDFTKRITIEVFEEWYEHQIMYQKVGRMPTITDLEKDYIRLQDAAALAGVTSGTITKWIQMEHFSSAGAGKALRIHWNEFLKWLKEYQEATQRRKKQKSEKLNINSLLEPLLSRNVPG